MYLLICQTLEIRPVHYPLINQGTHSFSGRAIKFLLKTTNHRGEGEPQRGLPPFPINICMEMFQSGCQGFRSLALPCVGVSIPIDPSDFKEYHFLVTLCPLTSGSCSAALTCSNYVTSFLLMLYLNISKWFGSVVSLTFLPGPRCLVLHSWNSANAFKIMSFTLGNVKSTAIITDSQYEISTHFMPSFL